MEKLFINRIFKTGASLVVALPPELRRVLLLERGDYIVWSVNADLSLTLRRVSKGEILEAKK